MRVESFLTNSAHKHPNKPAIVAGKIRVSYAELNDRAEDLATTLARSGVRRGDRVVILADSSVMTVVSIFASLKLGAIFSPVNPTIKADKLTFILNNCRATAIIAPKTLAAIVAAATANAPSVTVELIDGVVVRSAAHGSVRAIPGIDIDLAMLIYTSGSTGFPKGVMMTHSNMVTASTSITTYLRNTEDDIILNALPLSFDYGLYQIIMSAQMGATVVLQRSFAYPMTVLATMHLEHATGFPIVPTMAAILLNLRTLRSDDFSHLRYITNTAAALPPAHIARLQELFPATALYSMYGLTECKRCTYMPPEQLAQHPGSVGVAIPNTEVYVVDEQGERLGPDKVGELVIRGGHVMRGYWENQEATDHALRPGPVPGEKVLYSGDLFQMDSDGFLYFVGRKDDIIKTRGEKVSPKEVENVLYSLPGILEAAIVGVPDPILGAMIKAIVVVENGSPTERDILAHCVRHLEDFMVPKLVEFRTSLPKTDSGKIKRSQLQAEESNRSTQCLVAC